MSFKTNQIMYWDEVKVTDHNRAPLEETYESIEREGRMTDGTLRKYVIALKKNWSCSWSDLPSHNGLENSGTVDDGMSGVEMQTFYEAHRNSPFELVLKNGQGDSESYSVMFSEFSRTINKRGAVDLWDVSITLKQV